MRIRCGMEFIFTKCTGCPCHWHQAIVMGKLHDGLCKECGCPKTKEAFDKIKAQQTDLIG